MNEILTLPDKSIQNFQNRLIQLKEQIEESSDLPWEAIGRKIKFDGEPLSWSTKPLSFFDGHMKASGFNLINYPPSRNDANLYFGRDFLGQYDDWSRVKVKYIELVCEMISSATGVEPRHSRQQEPQDGTSLPSWLIGGLFKKLPLERAYKFFLQLSEYPSAEAPSLKPEEVEQFIRRALLNDSKIDLLTLNIEHGQKGIIVGLFHKFYKGCEKHRKDIGTYDPSPKADTYKRLLLDHFSNFEGQNDISNFRDGGHWKDLE